MKYTLITGASQGMGLLMAKKCATLKRNVLLISLPNENREIINLLGTMSIGSSENQILNDSINNGH